MSTKLRSNRARSTSDLLEQGTKADQDQTASRYRTFTFEDARRRKECARNVTPSERRGEPSTPRSHSFVKKLIASLEKRNEACKADDEFLRYYKRPSPYKADLFQSRFAAEENDSDFTKRNTRQRRSVNVKLEFEDAERERERDYESFNLDEFERRKSFTNPRSSREFEIVTDGRTFVKDPSIGRRRLSFQIQDLLKLSRSTEKDESRSTEPRNFVETLKESDEKTTDGKREKKVVRKRSFKNLLGSMIKWKKSERKEEPKRFLSCDEFLRETMKLQSRSFEELTKRAAELRDCETEYEFQESNDLVHPVYKRPLDGETRRITLDNVPESFVIEEEAERLVRPSAIRDITRRLSLLSDNSRDSTSLQFERRYISTVLSTSRDTNDETRERIARGRSFKEFKEFGVVLDDEIYSRSMKR